MSTINEGDCCGCGSPSCTPVGYWVRATIGLPGAAALNPWGTFAWPSGGSTALYAQNTYCPYGSTLDPLGGDSRAATRYLQIDDNWSSSQGGPSLTTLSSTATRTRIFDKDTGQETYYAVTVTSTDTSNPLNNSTGTWSLDVTTGSVTTTGHDPRDLWANHNTVFQSSVSGTFGTDDPRYNSASINVSATGFDYTFAQNLPDGTFVNDERKCTLSSAISLSTLTTNAIAMLTTIDLTNLAATYTYDDSTVHAIHTDTSLTWAAATTSPAAGKKISIHDGWPFGALPTRAEMSVNLDLEVQKGRVHVCSSTNLYEQEETAPVPNTAGPGAPDNGSSQMLSGATDCDVAWCGSGSTCYVSPSDVEFTWGYATPAGC